MLRRPIFVILGIVLLLFLFGWIIFSIDWAGNEVEKAQQEKFVATQLNDGDSRVRMIQRGPIVYNNVHQEVWITVSATEVRAEYITGYRGVVSTSKILPNTQEAFESFLAALENEGFSNKRINSGSQTELGACPQGSVYKFQAYNSNETLHESWTTSCTREIGSFTGDFKSVVDLFQEQVPDYDEFYSQAVKASKNE